MLKNTYKGRFLTIKKDIQKILGLKIQTVKTCSSASSTHTNFYFLFKKNTKISIFGGISKFCFWADFSKFWQFWAEFTALVVADNMPKVWLNLKNFITFEP
jgi:hypothetical protein